LECATARRFDPEASRPRQEFFLTPLKAAVLLAEEGNKQALADKTDATCWDAARQHGDSRDPTVFLNPFCPFTTAKVLALKVTVLLLLTLLIKTKIRITAFSALAIVAGGATLYATQQRQPAAA
jgi:hypothetical protein